MMSNPLPIMDENGDFTGWFAHDGMSAIQMANLSQPETGSAPYTYSERRPLSHPIDGRTAGWFVS